MITVAYHQYANTAYMGGSYASASIAGPMSTSQTPLQMANHNSGVLTGQHPNPPQFYPADGASNFRNARAQYIRTNTTQHNFQSGPKPTLGPGFMNTHYYSADLQKSFRSSSSMKYIAPSCSSLYTSARKSAAVGQSSLKQGLPNFMPLSYKSFNSNDVRNSLRSCRSSGCVAPPKCGAPQNRSRCSGGTCAWGSIVSQNY